MVNFLPSDKELIALQVLYQ